MIREITIENFKSVRKVTLPLGRINVFIGENGCGKSNLLEAIAFVGAETFGEILPEALASRGVRVTSAEFMRAAYIRNAQPPISAAITADLPDVKLNWTYAPAADSETEAWRKEIKLSIKNFTKERKAALLATLSSSYPANEVTDDFADLAIRAFTLSGHRNFLATSSLDTFAVFAPENTALRTFQSESQLLPLGIRGEGLFAHLKALSQSADHQHVLATIAEHLDLIDWFGGLQIPNDLAPFERTLKIRDRYLTDGRLFDQRSANEGFLFLLFYFTLMLSPHTPKFFAIDNVETSLNPKLARELIRRLAALAVPQDRQLLLTTHSPAVLDGLDLNDDEQRLFVVTRSSEGDTRVRRVHAPQPQPGEPPVRLSEAFMMGYLGGLPKNF